MRLQQYSRTAIKVDLQQNYADASSSSSTTARPHLPRNDLSVILSSKPPDDEMAWSVTDEKPPIYGPNIVEDYMFVNQTLGQGEEVPQQLLDYALMNHNEFSEHYNPFGAFQQQQQQMTMLNHSLPPVLGNAYENGGFAESQMSTLTETKQCDENADKSIERRQKRMIKNRESAARSRARKQQYINNLEASVKDLKRENEWLRKRKKVDMLYSNAIPEPKPKLRRTRSAPLIRYTKSSDLRDPHDFKEEPH